MVMSSGPAWCSAALLAGGHIDIAGAFVAANELGVLARVEHPNGSSRFVVWAPGDSAPEDRMVEVQKVIVGRDCRYLGDPMGESNVVNGTVRGRSAWLFAPVAPDPQPKGSSAPHASPVSTG